MADYTRLDALTRALTAEVHALQAASGRRGTDGTPFATMQVDRPSTIDFCTWRGEPAQILTFEVGGVKVRITTNDAREIVLVSIGKV